MLTTVIYCYLLPNSPKNVNFRMPIAYKQLKLFRKAILNKRCWNWCSKQYAIIMSSINCNETLYFLIVAIKRKTSSLLITTRSLLVSSPAEDLFYYFDVSTFFLLRSFVSCGRPFYYFEVSPFFLLRSSVSCGKPSYYPDVFSSSLLFLLRSSVSYEVPSY